MYYIYTVHLNPLNTNDRKVRICSSFNITLNKPTSEDGQVDDSRVNKPNAHQDHDCQVRFPGRSTPDPIN